MNFTGYFIAGAFFFILLTGKSTQAQSVVLESYVKQGVENNLALKQKELNLEKSLFALKEAKALFYPSVNLEAQYFLAKGGRSIDFPLGDLFNPVYNSLNEILTNMGEPAGFPQLQNQKIQFLPNDYHDSKMRVVTPLVNAEIYFNQRIKKELIHVTQAEVNVYKRELVKDIKTAYYRYLQSSYVVDAYKSAVELVKEALRVNTRLVENQMAGRERLLRIESEKSQVTAQLAKAENDMQTAAAYFNFLINEPINSKITVDSTLAESVLSFETAAPGDDREEIIQLNSAVKSAALYYRMKKAARLPVITNITDLGYQGYSYSFNRDQQYVMNTLNFSWPLFGGFQNRRKTAQAKIDMQTLEKKRDETEQQLQLQTTIANGNFKTSLLAREACLSSLASSKEYYKVVSRQYQSGQKSLLDLLDARNQLTSAMINYQVSHFESLIKQAELERTTASVNLDIY